MTLAEKKSGTKLEEIEIGPSTWSGRTDQDRSFIWWPLRKLWVRSSKRWTSFVEGQISSLETKIRYAEIVDSDAVAVDEVAIGKTVTVKKLAKQMKKYTASSVQQGQMPLQERFLTKAQSVTLWLVRRQVTLSLLRPQLEATKWKFWT